jgi:large conductance mechanosensitive channel
MSYISEFKEFALKGNVIDLAVGVVIGAAFGKIVSSLVDDIITPAVLTPVLQAAKLSDLSQLVIPGTAIKYGNFLSQVISFLLVAVVLFLIIKTVNTAKKKEALAPASIPPPTTTEVLLADIRDVLREKNK